jgi:hypothetical protein
MWYFRHNKVNGVCFPLRLSFVEGVSISMHCCVTTSVRRQLMMEPVQLLLEMFQQKCLVLLCIICTLILCR